MGNMLFYVNPPPKLPLAQLFYMESFAAAEQFDQALGTGGVFNIDVAGMTLRSGNTSDEISEIFRFMDLYFYDATWDKRREFKTHLRLTLPTPDFGEIMRFGLGMPVTGNFMGITIHDGEIYANSRNAGDEEETSIYTIYPLGETLELKLHLKHFPLSHVEFWMNGSLVASHALQIPAGPGDGPYFINATVAAGFDNPTYLEIKLETGYFELYQEI